MIPILYKADEKIFGHNGIGVLQDTLTCNVREVRNGAFNLELVYPVSGQWYKELKDFMIISAKPNDIDEPHLFRIYEIIKNLKDHTVTVLGTTRSNDLGGNIISPVTIEDKTPQVALTAIKDALLYPTDYNFVSNIQTKASGSWKDMNPLNCISGSEGSMISIWGGEIKRTNDTIYLYGRRGKDKVTTIRPGKGLAGFDMTVSTKGMTTAILPIARYTTEGSDKETIVRGTVVESELVSNYPVKYIRPIDYSSEPGILPEGEFSDAEYKALVLSNINARSLDYFTVQYPGSDKPSVTINVDMLQLSDSPEYSKFKGLETIGLTDTVDIWVEKFDVDVTLKVQEILYDSLSERVISIVAGNAKHSLYKDVEKTYEEKIDKIKEYVDTVENGIYNTIRDTADGKNNVFSGYTTPDEELVKVNDIWYRPVDNGEIEMYRWNGAAWALAIGNADKLQLGTLDARLVNLIYLNASNIATGTVTGAHGAWNLETGDFWLGSNKAEASLSWDHKGLTIRMGSGETLDEYMDSLKVGGTNLLKDSAKKISTSAYGMNNYYIDSAETIASGETVTFTLKGILASAKTSFVIYNSGGSIQLGYLSYQGNGIYQGTFNWKSGADTHVVVYQFPSGTTATSSIDWVKLERGNMGTDWSPAPSEIYTGITRVDEGGVNVGRSNTEINSQMSYDGFSVRDGEETITSMGESGAIIPILDSNNVTALNIAYNNHASGSYDVGPGRIYADITSALEDLFGMNSSNNRPKLIRTNRNLITLNVYNTIIDSPVIYGLTGGGVLEIVFKSGSIMHGSMSIENTTNTVNLKGPGRIVSTGAYNTITIVNTSVSITDSLQIDASKSTIAITTRQNSSLYLNGADIIGAPYAVFADYASHASLVDNRGNSTNTTYYAQRGGFITCRGARPVGSSPSPGTRGFIIDTGGSPMDSAFSPTPVTAQTFKKTFTAATFDTLANGVSVNSHFGASAAQNKWTTGMTSWQQGRIRMSSDVRDFYSGGTSISVRMRLRRKNSSHGTSAAVAPTPSNFSCSMSGAVRGGWTGWGSVSYGTFGTSVDLRLGSNTYSNYAIWDAIQVEVTVTKTV